MLHPNSALSEQVAEFIVLLRGLEEMETFTIYILLDVTIATTDNNNRNS